MGRVRHFTGRVGAVLALTVTFFSVGGQVAAATPYVWDNRKGVAVVPLMFAPVPQGNGNKVKLWMIEGTKFRMSCYTYNKNYTGNWNTSMWLYGQEYSQGSWGYIHASYVINQTTVGRC